MLPSKLKVMKKRTIFLFVVQKYEKKQTLKFYFIIISYFCREKP